MERLQENSNVIFSEASCVFVGYLGTLRELQDDIVAKNYELGGHSISKDP